MNINKYLRSLTESGIKFRAYPQDDGGFSVELIDKKVELFYAANGDLYKILHFC